MFLSAVTFAKSKSKTILVKMMSQAGTGFSFNTKRSRLREKLTLLHYDPVEETEASARNRLTRLRSPVCQVIDSEFKAIYLLTAKPVEFSLYYVSLSKEHPLQKNAVGRAPWRKEVTC
ncbi:39S ribosomal protein L33, mitochondrial isoform X1 [Phacochoerus africanus]|uniref:39S ribosomal protein L33, mitochondrial isoform X1 n=1 Tax=Phacochoerus africanus TaxID=41426 RepID=UPI001FDA447A|nr:39S ribosomal protein L33, mitochondrial isoform X1 [Phacochoerus africanus]